MHYHFWRELNLPLASINAPRCHPHKNWLPTRPRANPSQSRLSYRREKSGKVGWRRITVHAQLSVLQYRLSVGVFFFVFVFVFFQLNTDPPSFSLIVLESTKTTKKEPLFPETVQKYAVGMTRVKKEEFTQKFELGVPLDLPARGSEDVLILYNSRAAMPNNQQNSLQTSVGLLSTEEAVENCEFLNMIFAHHDGPRKQCTAILPQYESYHIQKWMRITQVGKKMEVNPKADLRLVPRGQQPNGVDSFKPPVFENHTRRSWELLKTYLASVDDVLAELKPIVDKIKLKNTVIVMVCNHGQSELLVNFACSTHARGLDISNILVFATDQETKELAESVGLAAYYDERVSS